MIAHKGAAAFALGVEFQRSGVDRSRYMRLLLTLASMTPLGIVLGAGLEHLLQGNYERLFERHLRLPRGGHVPPHRHPRDDRQGVLREDGERA